MSKFLFVVAVLFAAINSVSAQTKYFSKSGTVSFFSKTSMENIDAVNKKATAILNTETGAMDFAILMKAFEFKKALMQEHFNENYVESDKFPKATFKGKIENLSAINFKKDGTYNAIISGDMTIHGVTKKVKTNGTFTVKGGKISGSSVFNLLLADYNITIPAAVKDKIAPEIKITVDVNYEPLAN